VNTIFRSISSKLLAKLRKKTYRRGYMAEHTRRGIAYQIRALRDQEEWSQGKFARQLEKPQSVVSRLEDPTYGKVTVQTLLEVANTFDVALQVRFISYSQFLRDNQDLTSVAMQVDSFEDDIAISDRDLITTPATNDGPLNLGWGEYDHAFAGTDMPKRAREPEMVSAG